MIPRILSVWSRFGSSQPGFFSGTVLLLLVMLSIHAGGIQASLSLGPEGNLPRFRDVVFYALSHDDAPSLLVNMCFLLLVGPCQERRWGTVAFLALSAVSMAALPCAYSLVLWVGVGEASRVCGYSAVHLALFTAQCRQVRGRRLLRCVPPWLLPWLTLLMALLLLPGSPALLHFCAICIGHNYSPSFIGAVQELEKFSCVGYIPEWAYISSSSRLRLPTHSTSPRHIPRSETLHSEDGGPSGSIRHPGPGPGWGMDPSHPGPGPGWGMDPSHPGPGPGWGMDPSHPGPGPSWGMDPSHPGPGPGWGMDPSHPGPGPSWGMDPSHPGAGFRRDMSYGASEAELLEEQLLHAGILASLHDTPDCSHPGAEGQHGPAVTAGVLSSLRDSLHPSEAKVELPKSSVSSLRLQQLERMGFPTEKAVVALAASRQLEGAVSLLIDDSIGSEAVVVGGAKSPGPSPLR